jgi:hypothetical protein
VRSDGRRAICGLCGREAWVVQAVWARPGWGELFDGGAAGDDGFGAFFEFAAGEEDTPAAGEADEADVGAEADDAPLVAAAGMRFAEAEDVVEAEVLRGHADHYRRERRYRDDTDWADSCGSVEGEVDTDRG